MTLGENRVYSSPAAAVTNAVPNSVAYNRNVSSHSSGDHKSYIKVPEGLALSGGHGEKLPHAFLLTSGAFPKSSVFLGV